MTLFHGSLILLFNFLIFEEYLISVLFMKIFVVIFQVLSEYRTTYSLVRRDDTKRSLVCYSVLIPDSDSLMGHFWVKGEEKIFCDKGWNCFSVLSVTRLYAWATVLPSLRI